MRCGLGGLAFVLVHGLSGLVFVLAHGNESSDEVGEGWGGYGGRIRVVGVLVLVGFRVQVRVVCGGGRAG